METQKRYPKRSATILRRENLSSDIVRLYFQLEHLEDLPEKLRGRHIKLFPFKDEYKKSYTISSQRDDVISLDIMLNRRGRAATWAEEVGAGQEVDIWGPKIETSEPIDLSAEKVLLVSDLTGFSTMEYILSRLSAECTGDYYLRTSIPLEITNHTQVVIHQLNDLDFSTILDKVDENMHGYFVLGSEELKEVVPRVNPAYRKNINFKAYWKN